MRGASILGVAALSSDFVWAVGSTSVGSGDSNQLVMRWDGELWTLD